MKFIVEVCVGSAVTKFLQHQNINVIDISDINPRMSDRDILNLAVSEKRILITIDKDFGDLVFTRGSPIIALSGLRMIFLPKKLNKLNC